MTKAWCNICNKWVDWAVYCGRFNVCVECGTDVDINKSVEILINAEQGPDGNWAFEYNNGEQIVRVETKGNYATIIGGLQTEHSLLIGVSEPVEGRWDNTHGLIIDHLIQRS